MAHFAKLGVGNIVEQVIVVHNNDLLVDGVETESKGIEFLHNLFNNSNTVYKQTSYNGTFRKNYGGVGYTYDLVRNAFIPPQPFISWSLNVSNKVIIFSFRCNSYFEYPVIKVIYFR